YVDEFLLVDDSSPDKTLEVARSLGLWTIAHEKNLGYGGNQKTCYRHALDKGADIVVMLHPDYQYEPRLVPVLAEKIASGTYDVVLGSRNDFLFDNEILVQLHMKRFRFGEISCPTKYFKEASSISFTRSTVYGIGVLKTALKYRLQKWGMG